MQIEENSQFSLSVIIPNYNKATYLYECVESVLRQTLLPDEIIIVDDCSTDESGSIIENFSKNNNLIHAFYLKENMGVSSARNIGLRYARGRYVTFLDADDFYGNVDKLKNEMELIRNYGEDIVAYSQLLFADEAGHIKKGITCKKKEYLVGNIYKKMLLGRFDFPALARDYCVKKSIITELGGYNEERNLYEDLELIIKIAEKYSFYCTYETGTVYRQATGGLSSQKADAHKKARNAIFSENISRFVFWKRIVYTIEWKLHQERLVLRNLVWKRIGQIKSSFQRR